MAAKPLFGFSLNLQTIFRAKNLKKDLPSSIVVFLIALPLCLGIALASGAPLFSGLITGILGGVIAGSLSGSQLSVSGPAAGLTVIILTAITRLGTFEALLVSVTLAGIIQVILGILKAGTIANYFPSAVIEGMLAAIGIILILKQFPHALGYDADFEGNERFIGTAGTTFSTIGSALSRINYGAVIISSLSLLVMIYWPKIRKLNRIPAPLIVVVTGILLSEAFRGSSLSLQPGQLVSLPGITSFSGLAALFKTPDFSHITDKEVWIVAGTIAVVASLETLLNLEAADKLDPIKRVSPANRELVAQGVGNIACGMLGGLPMTSVIVRTSANVHSGAKSKLSAILHGIWLLLSFLLIPELINQIPLSCLAAILLFTGYKLARISLFRKMWAHGRDQFIPFTATIVAVVCTDLLTGVGIGMAIGIFFILRTNLRNPYFYTIASDGTITIRLAEEVSFLNKAAIQYMLAHLPSESTVAIDGTNSRYIDRDVLEIIHNFKHHAHTKAIIVMLKNLKEHYSVPALKDLIYHPKSKI